jgi:hypothetical protein
LQAQGGHAHTAPLINFHRQSMENQNLDPSPSDLGRPASPAWSLRSKTGSSQGHESGGLFSWARGEGSKLKFGSKRAAKTSAPPVDQ